VHANETDFCRDLDPGTREQLITLLTPLAQRASPSRVHPGLTAAVPISEHT
jgi:hypothetical protein